MCATHVDLSWMLSIPNYFCATISAVLGALIGIGWTKRRYKREQRENEEKIRQSLLDCLTFNLERASQAREKLQSGGMPNFPMDATKLSSLILQAHGLLSAQLLRDLD